MHIALKQGIDRSRISGKKLKYRMLEYPRGMDAMARYLLTDAENHTWRGSTIYPGHSVFSSNTPDNIVSTNADEMGESALMAIMLNPWHSQLEQRKMLELEFSQISVVKSDPRISMLVRETQVPSVTTDQKIVFALMVIQEVYKNEVFCNWSENWISGNDRSPESAGKMFSYLGMYARKNQGRDESLKAMGLRSQDLNYIDADDRDFCARSSEAIFAAQMYMDRSENWPLLASRSVSRAVTGLRDRADLAAVAEKAIASSAKGVMRRPNAA
jgi:hypothetical protein